MEFNIENGVLKKYSNEEKTKSVIIPEGVTEISYGVFSWNKTESMEIILPKSLRNIEDDNFHNAVPYDNNYKGCTIVLYGVAIDLKEIYYACHDGYDYRNAEDLYNELESKGFRGIDPYEDYCYDADGEIYYIDDDTLKDTAYEHHEKLETEIIDGVIEEINHILSRNFDIDFEYLPFDVLHEILTKISIEEPENIEVKNALNSI